jgi:putative transposase
MIELSRQYGRYGYRRIAAMLREAGWQPNDKRVERLWRREGLKVPMKQPRKGRLWLNDGSCVIDALTDLFIIRGVPAYIRSDNGPEFIAEAVR